MDMQSIVRDVLALNLDEKGKKLRSCDVISAFPRDEFPSGRGSRDANVYNTSAF